VKTYFSAAGGFSEPEVIKRVELPEGQQLPMAERAKAWLEGLLGGGSGNSDPFFAVVARKQQP
jgi:hypothetical protein